MPAVADIKADAGPLPVDENNHPLQSLDSQGKTASNHEGDTTASRSSLAPVTQYSAQAHMTKSRAAAVFLSMLTQGVNDSVTGALLPYIEAHYGINYAIASLIFVANAIGFLLAAPLVHQLERRWGRGKIMPFAALCNAVAYAVVVAQVPFAAVAVCFAVLGFGFSLSLALNNAFLAHVPNATVFMGIMQGGYGLGGTVAPLLGTALASNGVRWSFFYFVSIGLCLIDALLLGWAFRNYESPQERTITPTATSERKDTSMSLLKRALRDRTTILGAFFIFAYQGAEVTISGWVVSFLIDYRHGDPSRVGYVTAGFWAGITVGRFLLCSPIHKLGDRLCIPVLVLVWACLHVAVWLSHDIIGDAVTVAIVGLLTGPIAPVVTGVLSRLLDPRIQMIGISIGWSVGSGGAAVAPFLTGLLSQKFGTVVLNPICIILCAVMEGAWFGLPGPRWKRH